MTSPNLLISERNGSDGATIVLGVGEIGTGDHVAGFLTTIGGERYKLVNRFLTTRKGSKLNDEFCWKYRRNP
jgi:hypothetical protein